MAEASQQQLSAPNENASIDANPSTCYTVQNPMPVGDIPKDRIQRRREVLCLKVPNERVGQVLQQIPHEHLLNMPQVKNIVADKEGGSRRLVRLSVSDEAALSDVVKAVVEKLELEVCRDDVVRTYKDFSYEEVLREILPASLQVPVSFETVGHIAHLNLPDSLLPYKFVIGHVLLEKLSHIQTVVRKVRDLEGVFRTLPMELIAGEPNYLATVKEASFTFKIDYQNVYWNSRLCGERKRLTDTIPATDVVYDVFAGIGGFGIYLARKGCEVHSNDLNRHCYEAMKTNSKGNKVTNFHAYNLDAREFIRLCLQRPLKAEQTSHFIMNLPETAIDFLDTFRNVRSAATVHCYCFSRSNPPDGDHVRRRVEQRIGYEVQPLSIKPVRNVAPNKTMYCLTFDLSSAPANKLRRRD